MRMRKPMLTNKVIRGLRCIMSNPSVIESFCGLHDQSIVRQGLVSSDDLDDAQRAREWVAAMEEWWRQGHEGRRP